MSLIISDEIVKASKLSEDELLIKLEDILTSMRQRQKDDTTQYEEIIK